MDKEKEIKLKEKADEWAKNVIVKINNALSDPSVGMDKIVFNVYKSLKENDLIDDLKEHPVIVQKFLSKDKYAKLFAEANKPRRLSKWEVITGQRRQR